MEQALHLPAWLGLLTLMVGTIFLLNASSICQWIDALKSTNVANPALLRFRRVYWAIWVRGLAVFLMLGGFVILCDAK